MAPSAINFDFLWEQAKGHISLGDLNVVWDLTGGLTKEQYMERQLRRWGLWTPKHYVDYDGRIRIPELGII